MKGKPFTFVLLGCASIIITIICWWQFLRAKPSYQVGTTATRNGVRIPSSPPVGFKSATTNDLGRESLAVPEELLKRKILESNDARILIDSWKEREISGAKYIKSHRARDGQVIILLPAVSAVEKNRLQTHITDMVENAGSGETSMVKDAVKQQLLAWFIPNTHETVVILDLVEIDHAGKDYLDGRWFEIEDSSKVKDEFQYIDYGKILNSATISEDSIKDRFEHLYKVAEN